MTDGIIQKVFRDFKDRNNYDVRDMVIHLPELEKELIEEIRKNVSGWSKQHSPPLSRYVKLDILIGDSE